MHPDAPAPSRDLEAAAWIAPRLNGRPGTVGDVVPTGFASYARILHPAEWRGGPVTWAHVAAETGRVVHPLVQWHRLIGTNDYLNARGGDWSGHAPRRGDLAPESLAVLLDALGRHTATPDSCWFGLWEGWGWIDARSGSVTTTFAWRGETPPPAPAPVPPAFTREVLAWPRVQTPGRDFLLLRGPLASARFIGHQVTADWFDEQSPQLIWPDDREWCVGTEIDFDSTVVGGSAELIDELLATEGLETWSVRPEDSLAYDADRIN
jgi:hypothetical protein